MPEIVKAKEVARRLHISQPTVYEWARTQGMPHIQIGQNFLFDWNDISQWLESKKVN